MDAMTLTQPGSDILECLAQSLRLWLLLIWLAYASDAAAFHSASATVISTAKLPAALQIFLICKCTFVCNFAIFLLEILTLVGLKANGASNMRLLSATWLCRQQAGASEADDVQVCG